MKEAQGVPSPAEPGVELDESGSSNSEKVTLELIFMVLVGVMLTAALVRALSYDIVSARPPLVILVPLLVLVGVRIHRLWAATHPTAIRGALSRLAKGENRQYAKAGELFAWIFLLLAFIYLGGHYAGIGVFMFLMMRGVAGESCWVATGVALSVSVALYLLFELGFEIELYRGLIYRIWAGYDVS